MPDIGTHQPFPQPHGKPPRLTEIAINIGGKFYPTRLGFVRVAEWFGYGVDYSIEPERITCTLRRGESVLGCASEPYATGETDAQTERQRNNAMRVALQNLLREIAPEVLIQAGEILAGAH